MSIVYVPVLKLRSSEMKALQFLNINVKEKVMPVIQILSDKLQDRKGDYLTVKLKELIGAFSESNMSFYADFEFVANGEIFLIKEFLKLVTFQNIKFIPVLSFIKSLPVYRNLIREKYLQNGVCLKFDEYRIKNLKTEDFLIYFNEVVSKCKGFFQINESQIDIHLCLEELNGNESKQLTRRLIEILSNIDNGSDFRRIFVSVGSFPKDLSEILVDTERILYRHEWEFWKSLQVLRNKFNLIYSDYGNIHPIYDPDQNGHIGSCSIKYTIEEDYLILRGTKPNKHPEASGQYRTKSLALVNNKIYDGPGFSWGDFKILQVAQQTESTGNASKWVQYTLNHHISKIYSLLN